MSWRERAWPDFREAWILHEDPALLAIDKPAGVPSQAADPTRPDDVVTRLRRFLVAQGKDEYLGTHQRLDRDTSGVLVMTRRRDVNAHVASEFEGRKVDKQYLACVTGWPKGKERAVLEDTLVPGDDGTMTVARAPKGRSRPRGQVAITSVRVRKRHGDRALLELTLETGRTHQARVQLAHAGAPIAGDPIYGGAPAPRLLLHAHTLTFVHPLSKQRTTFTAPMPIELERWLQRGDEGDRIYDDVAALDAAILRALERRFALARGDDGPRKTTAFRAIHEEGDGLPGLAVDVYGEHLVAQFHGDDAIWANRERRERVLDRLQSCIRPAGIYLKVRPRQANTLVETRREDVAPKDPVRGTAADDVLTVFEEGVAYDVRLGDGLSTGIFLDQRANRVRVRGLAAGARIANLFSYTCAFSIAAAVGGAKSTVSVDASPAALERGREGLIKLGLLETGDHRFVAEDAFSWLSRAAKKAERFDLVILDPPSYSVTKARRFVASTDYGELVAAAIAVVAPRGRLLASTNHRGIARHKLRKAVAEGVRRAGRSAAQIKDLPESVDFPAPVGGEPYMKAVLVTLAD